MENKDLLSFIGGGYWQISKEMKKAFGMMESLWITHLLEWQQYLISIKKIKEDEYFYLSQKEIQEETGIHPDTQTSFIKRFVERGILYKKENIGLPARNYYYINAIKMIETIRNINRNNQEPVTENDLDLAPKESMEPCNNPNCNNPNSNISKEILDVPSEKKERHLSTEFINLKQNKNILKEVEEIFDYWRKFGKPLSSPFKNLEKPTIKLQNVFVVISKELKRLSKKKIKDSIYLYYEMLVNTEKYNLNCSDPLHLVDISDFFKFNDYLKKKQMSARENNPAKYIKSWYWECAQGEKYLFEKYGRKPKDNYKEKPVEIVNREHEMTVSSIKQSWEKFGFKNGKPQDENCFRKGALMFMDFLKEHERDWVYGASGEYPDKPWTVAKLLVKSIEFSTKDNLEIEVTPAWLCTKYQFEERLPKYLKFYGALPE